MFRTSSVAFVVLGLLAPLPARSWAQTATNTVEAKLERIQRELATQRKLLNAERERLDQVIADIDVAFASIEASDANTKQLEAAFRKLAARQKERESQSADASRLATQMLFRKYMLPQDFFSVATETTLEDGTKQWRTQDGRTEKVLRVGKDMETYTSVTLPQNQVPQYQRSALQPQPYYSQATSARAPQPGCTNPDCECHKRW